MMAKSPPAKWESEEKVEAVANIFVCGVRPGHTAMFPKSTVEAGHATATGAPAQVPPPEVPPTATPTATQTATPKKSEQEPDKS